MGITSKRLVAEDALEQMLLSPGLKDAPVMDLMCSHFVLTLATKQGPKFNVRRDLNSLLALTGRHMVWPTHVFNKIRAFLNIRCKDNEIWRGHEALNNLEFLERHGLWRGPYEEGTMYFYLDEFAKDQPKEILSVLAITVEWLTNALKKQSTLIEKNIAALSNLLQLNKAERALLLYGTMARYQRDVRSILVEFKVANAPEAFAAIAEVAGVTANEIGEALRAGSRLERIGLIENLISEHSITDLSDLMKVSEKLPPVLMREYRDQGELMAVFTKPALKSALTLHDFSFVKDDTQVLCALIKNAVERKELGVNVLLYGPPGTGKTELAKVVAQSSGLDLYEVEYADRDGNSLSGRDRYRSLQIAQSFLKGSPQVALMFDEVEDVFPAVSIDAANLMARQEQMAYPSSSSQSINGKAWVNQILETNPVPTIWVTNRIEQIDPAFRRRFAYHLELKSPPPGAREQLVRKTLEGVEISSEFVAKLTERKGLTPAQIRTAVRFAGLAKSEDMGLETLIERQLKNADAALGTKIDGDKSRPTVTSYNLDMLNVESRFEIPRIVKALKDRGHGTLCFYGAPGTGKTALAEHIAKALEKPLIIKQASDLMSKFVGETEQNMAAMFKEAEAEGAVLLLDEADSYLQDRRGAQRSYEVTEVNEMLQGMERFKGIFVCTTNLLDRIDQAALRRFSFKIKFKPLTAEQRETMFVTEALAGETVKFDAELKARLAKLEVLCPGDFAAVKRQIDILGEGFTADEFMSQLEAEHRIKPEVRESRGMGFLQ